MPNRFESSFAEHQISEDWQNLHDGEETVAGSFPGPITAELPQDVRAVLATLDVTAAQTNVDDELDVWVQTRLQNTSGDIWIDVIHFEPILGNGGPLAHVDKVVAALNQDDFLVGAALGDGAHRHIIGDLWRIRWILADGGGAGDPGFTFTVDIQPQ